MKFIVALGILLSAIAADAGHSMHNPFFCYMTDSIRSMTNMHSIITSYEAIRRFNFTTVNPYVTSEFFNMKCEYLDKVLLFRLYTIQILVHGTLWWKIPSSTSL